MMVASLYGKIILNTVAVHVIVSVTILLEYLNLAAELSAIDIRGVVQSCVLIATR